MINWVILYEFVIGCILGVVMIILVDFFIIWEICIICNIGFDLEIMDGKLEFIVEYYFNILDDVLIDLFILLFNGFLVGLMINVGFIQNFGVEFLVIWCLCIGDVVFNILFNFYILRNEVFDIGILDFFFGIGVRIEVGCVVGEYYGWVYDGIFQIQGEVEFYVF